MYYDCVVVKSVPPGHQLGRRAKERRCRQAHWRGAARWRRTPVGDGQLRRPGSAHPCSGLRTNPPSLNTGHDESSPYLPGSGSPTMGSGDGRRRLTPDRIRRVLDEERRNEAAANAANACRDRRPGGADRAAAAGAGGRGETDQDREDPDEHRLHPRCPGRVGTRTAPRASSSPWRRPACSKSSSVQFGTTARRSACVCWAAASWGCSSTERSTSPSRWRPGGDRPVVDLAALGRGSGDYVLDAEGIVGGCNTGGLSAWAGTLKVTTRSGRGSEGSPGAGVGWQAVGIVGDRAERAVGGDRRARSSEDGCNRLVAKGDRGGRMDGERFETL